MESFTPKKNKFERSVLESFRGKARTYILSLSFAFSTLAPMASSAAVFNQESQTPTESTRMISANTDNVNNANGNVSIHIPTRNGGVTVSGGRGPDGRMSGGVRVDTPRGGVGVGTQNGEVDIETRTPQGGGTVRLPRRN